MNDDLGLSRQAAVLAFGFGNPAPATPAAPPATTPTPGPPSGSPVGPQGEISPAQAAQMIEWEKENLAKGKITPEEAAKRFDALGATPEQRAPDTRTDEQRLLDVQFSGAKPEEYQIRYATPGQAWPEMTPELKQFDTTARSWLSQAEFPRELGNSLITNIEKVVQQTKSMMPDQLESYRIVEHSKMQRIYGDTLQAKLNAADDMIDQLEAQRAGLINLLGSKGIGKNAIRKSVV